MLGHCKCGGILDACKVFQGLDDPNVVSGYMELVGFIYCTSSQGIVTLNVVGGV